MTRQKCVFLLCELKMMMICDIATSLRLIVVQHAPYSSSASQVVYELKDEFKILKIEVNNLYNRPSCTYWLNNTPPV